MVDECLLHIKALYPSLRPAERRVADEILEHASEVVHLSITAVARRAGVSDATVVKFCKRLGYKGFQDLKIRLAANVAVAPKPIYGEINRDDDIAAIKEKTFRINMQALEDTIRTLDSRVLAKAVAAMVKAPSIHFYGIGASGIVAEDAQQKFMRIGLTAVAFIDYHVQRTMAALLHKGDVAMGISYSGQTWEIAEALRVAKKTGATTICLTNFPESQVTRYAHLQLFTSSSETILRSGAISSRIAQLSTIDSLFLGVALAKYDQASASIEKTIEAIGDRSRGR